MVIVPLWFEDTMSWCTLGLFIVLGTCYYVEISRLSVGSVVSNGPNFFLRVALCCNTKRYLCTRLKLYISREQLNHRICAILLSQFEVFWIILWGTVSKHHHKQGILEYSAKALNTIQISSGSACIHCTTALSHVSAVSTGVPVNLCSP